MQAVAEILAINEAEVDVEILSILCLVVTSNIPDVNQRPGIF